jgi:chaperonin GroEL (HSP60 family)
VAATEETLSDRYERWAEAIVAVDPDLVVTRKGAAAVIRRRLTAAGITLVHRAKPTDVLGRLAASTGASVVSNVDDTTTNDLGTAEEVALREFNDLEYVTIRGDATGPWTLLVRNWTWSAVELAGDATDVLLAVGDRATAEQSYLPGAGAAEVDAAGAVRERAQTVDDRQALAVEAYAEALEDTVRVLARNLGRDPARSLSLLRSAPRGNGLVGARGEVGDALAAGVLDLGSAKRGAVAGATNTALTLLRVDALVTTD